MNHIREARPIRFALVGAGRIGQSHLDALGGAEGAQLVAVVETRKAAGEAVAEQRKVRWFADHKDPELRGMIDAVIVSAPPNVHHDVAKHFLGSGVHVLCEKPLTIKSADAEELIDVAKKSGTLLMMASKFRYVDDIIKAKAVIEAGLLGRIVLYENTFCGKVSMKDRWNAQKEIAGGGVLIDNGTHSIDIARYLLGPISEVQAQNGVSAQGLDVEDTARLEFRTKNGVMGAVDLSWSINKEQEQYVAVYGSEGTLLIGWKGSRYRQDGSPAWVPFGSGYDKIGCLRRQIENFVGVLRGVDMPRITPEDALASVKVIETAYASAHRWVEVRT
jgi:predicted dehydrogenase